MPEALMLLANDGIAAIERATLKAVAPEVIETLPGWLLPMDSGTVGRARSAVPLHHGEPDLTLLATILQCYADRGFSPALRLPETPAFEHYRLALAARGFERSQPTHTQVGRVADLLTLPTGAAVELAAAPDAGWLAMFLGEGLDPVDGASRAASLARASGTCFASLRHAEGQTLASGAASLAEGWLSVHGMRTAAAWRGRGLATQVLCAMALEAQHHHIEQVFLQVDASNTPALKLYQRLGFQTAWTYAYWRPTASV
jgi:ribosomal protein S18 acetylase RimI-like enzyme